MCDSECSGGAIPVAAHRLIQAVRQAASVCPEVTNDIDADSCYFDDDGSPSNLLGVGLWCLGWSAANFYSSFRIGDDSIDTAIGEDTSASIVADSRERRWLLAVEDGNDIGIPWGSLIAAIDGRVLPPRDAFDTDYCPTCGEQIVAAPASGPDGYAWTHLPDTPSGYATVHRFCVTTPLLCSIAA